MNGAAIFAYHNFVERPGEPAPTSQAYVLSQAQFDAHLDALADPGLRPSRLADVVSAHARRRIEAEFSRERMVRETESLYTTLLQEGRHGHAHRH